MVWGNLKWAHACGICSIECRQKEHGTGVSIVWQIWDKFGAQIEKGFALLGVSRASCPNPECDCPCDCVNGMDEEDPLTPTNPPTPNGTTISPTDKDGKTRQDRSDSATQASIKA